MGVLQGASTSSLFILYLDRMVKMIRSACPDDGFLGALSVLLLMDDTAIVELYTTHAAAEQKINVLLAYCNLYGMKVNQDKTKFMVINADPDDKRPIVCCYNEGPVTIQYTNKYVYL